MQYAWKPTLSGLRKTGYDVVLSLALVAIISIPNNTELFLYLQ